MGFNVDFRNDHFFNYLYYSYMLFFFRNMPSFCVFLSSSSFFFVQQSNSPTDLSIEICKQLKIKYLQNLACRTVRIRLLVLLVGRWKAPSQQK
ncbi:TPA_asm: hypothetical protein [Porphyromonas phage phage022a_WW2931]|uniref:Uncharacterized protein n=1 Tax=Porphyromonas phage phage022a_WW2931 TaxID=3154112 RepID=A0AAT9JMC0_9CAUD